ncbi:MAG: hypothetical protein ACI9XC_002651 [Gammaproteobacteria bacterium]|jgi:hypothetical protein
MRVSTFIYLYRKLCLGEGEEMASQPMKKVWVPNEIWQSFINRVLKVHFKSMLKITANDAVPDFKGE